MEVLDYLLRVLFFIAPYGLAAGAGAYLEGKYGSKAAADIAALKADIAALKAKV
jgi:hypothetical protein